MLNIILITIGGALGSVLRYLVSSGMHQYLPRTFPYGTLTVNIMGCFLMGFLFIVLLERFDGLADHLRALLLIGFLGGFTTFSSFSIETLNLMQNGEMLRALINIMVSIIFCLLACWVGIMIGKQILSSDVNNEVHTPASYFSLDDPS